MRAVRSANHAAQAAHPAPLVHGREALEPESPLTMIRNWAAVPLLIAFSSAAGAFAQTVEATAATACPGEPMSLYFASGETSLSEEGRLLVNRLVDHAVACRPDGIDLVTRINPGVDGDRAVALALARLSDISQDLVTGGVSPNSIRVAAQPGSDVFPPGMSEVEVFFRKASPGAGDASSHRPATPRQPPADTI